MATTTPVNISATGDNIVISGGGSAIKVVGIALIVDRECSIQAKDGSNLLGGPMTFRPGGQLILPFTNGPAWFSCTGTNNFVLNISALGSVTPQISGSVISTP
jgi:hypothetical protein